MIELINQLDSTNLCFLISSILILLSLLIIFIKNLLKKIIKKS